MLRSCSTNLLVNVPSLDHFFMAMGFFQRAMEFGCCSQYIRRFISYYITVLILLCSFFSVKEYSPFKLVYCTRGFLVEREANHSAITSIDYCFIVIVALSQFKATLTTFTNSTSPVHFD
jgi:hypothetical protein